MSNSHVLEVQGLSKQYGKLEAVKEISFTVKKGEIFGIMGPNGAGKSTSLECILGTRKKNAGTVSILGMDAEKERRRLFQHVGVQFQNSAYQTGIRVNEICELTACLYEDTPDWKPLLKRFDLEKRQKAAVSSLSGGERQKLSILLASMHNPDIVFFDELTTGLDPLARRETWRFIRQLANSGTTVVLSSHFMDEVETLCNRGIILNEGSIIAEGSISELIYFGSGKNLDDSYINMLGGAGI